MYSNIVEKHKKLQNLANYFSFTTIKVRSEEICILEGHGMQRSPGYLVEKLI